MSCKLPVRKSVRRRKSVRCCWSARNSCRYRYEVSRLRLPEAGNLLASASNTTWTSRFPWFNARSIPGDSSTRRDSRAPSRLLLAYCRNRIFVRPVQDFELSQTLFQNRSEIRQIRRIQDELHAISKRLHRVQGLE